MGFLVVILGTLLLGTLAGWVGHWALHRRWAGRFHAAHLTHHRLYPPSNFQSASYRDAKRDSTTFFLAPIITFVVLAWLGTLMWVNVAWYAYIALILVGIAVGYAHDYLHEAFHLQNHWLDRFGWFQRLRRLHLGHHRSIGKNIGIIWFGWDRLFRTFKKP